LHTSFVSFVGNGIVNQLKSEKEAAKRLQINWDIILVSSNKKFDKKYNFYYVIPHLFNNYFLKRLYYHLFLIRYIKKKKPKIILFRYMKADFFSLLFSSYYKNRVTVHHSIELDEINTKNLKGKFLKWIEIFFGKRFLSKSKAIIGMTSEIVDHELQRLETKLPSLVLPNGIDYHLFSCVDDNRKEDINVVFIASQFHTWHGLDLLIDLLEQNETDIIFHLIGRLPENLKNRIVINDKLAMNFILYGYLERKQIIEVIEICDIGIDSLALFRKNMTSACSLKTREYLASGLPVFSSSKDSGLPLDFKYYCVNNLTIKALKDFAISSKKYSRQDIRDAAKRYIDKDVLTLKLNDFLKSI
jgi:hypothetical protein